MHKGHASLGEKNPKQLSFNAMAADLAHIGSLHESAQNISILTHVRNMFNATPTLPHPVAIAS